MSKVSRTYRIEQETADRIADISESEGKTATEVVEAAIRAYSSEEYAGNTAKQADSTDSPALAALIDQLAVKDAQLAKKDEQIAKPLDVLANVVIEGIDLVTVLFRLILIEDDGEAPRLHCRFSHMVSVL